MIYLKKITKNGQISIPRKFSKQLFVSDGDFIYIYLEDNSLVITRSHTDDSLNKCIFGNGKVTIPNELRKELNITNTTLLLIRLHSDHQKIIINCYPIS